MNRNGSNDTLYMCGNAKRAVGGQITGDWDGERLTRISGTIGGRAVVGGRLGGNYYRNVDGELRPRWFLTLAGLGRFFFEQMPINQISGTQLTLWGQNRAAYVCKTARCRNRHRARGIDLYGRAQTALPEPGSLGVLLAGLAGLSLAIRQRRLSIAKVFPAAR